MKLKTLKDIDWKELGHGDSVDIVENDTLRHFKIALYPSTYRKKLKQEAIKWAKSKHCMNFATAFDSDIMSNASEAMGALKIITHIFNITEEDITKQGLTHQKNNQKEKPN